MLKSIVTQENEFIICYQKIFVFIVDTTWENNWFFIIITLQLKEVQEGIVEYVPLITEIFERLPREMILILKTNDLLRGLDARLRTKTASASFIAMSKCCLRALYHDERAKCAGMYSRLLIDCRYIYDMSRLVVFQFFSSPFGRMMEISRQSVSRRISNILLLLHLIWKQLKSITFYNSFFMMIKSMNQKPYTQRINKKVLNFLYSKSQCFNLNILSQ